MRNVTFSENTKGKIAKLTEAVQACNDARKEGKPYAEKGGLLDAAKEKAKAVNKAIVEDAMNDLEAMAKADKTAMLRSYMEDWTVLSMSVKDTDTGVEVSQDNAQRIDLRTLDKHCSTVKITTRGDWATMLNVLVDNLLTDWADGEKVAKLGLPAQLVAEREKFGENWVKDGKPLHNIKNLTAQTNEIISAIFPTEMAVALKEKDIHVLKDLAKDYKDAVGNTALEFRAVTGRKIERRFFQLVYTRMNDLAIIISDDHKREGAQGQPAGDGERPAEGGPVKVVDAPAEEKPAKGSKNKAAAKGGKVKAEAEKQ